MCRVDVHLLVHLQDLSSVRIEHLTFEALNADTSRTAVYKVFTKATLHGPAIPGLFVVGVLSPALIPSKPKYEPRNDFSDAPAAMAE